MNFEQFLKNAKGDGTFGRLFFQGIFKMRSIRKGYRYANERIWEMYEDTLT